MKLTHTHYLSSKIESRDFDQKGSHGLFARTFIPAGDLLIVWGGVIMSLAEVKQVPHSERQYAVQVDEDAFLLTPEPEAGDFINHSCNPNAGLSGQISVIALRDIYPGEEVCFDYAMSDSVPYDEFECACGEANCRGRVTGNDWLIPELQVRYAGYFSPYLQRRINRLQVEQHRRALAQTQPYYGNGVARPQPIAGH
ncbi:MAG: SET domain-containing protein-lysine N-methyltransferase [Anaerolineae bacterium]|nr:SET domain-containing protein-lysine N-methyltransferase [Anaerolineae bacterium]